MLFMLFSTKKAFFRLTVCLRASSSASLSCTVHEGQPFSFSFSFLFIKITLFVGSV